jgi:tripartite-type tricarboxylate transporter receptor subunit TctC
MRRYSFVTLATLAFAAAVLSKPALADWPDRRITLIVPFAAAGGADPVARLIAEDLGKRLGQPVTVEFKPGGGGSLGTAAVAKSKPDGYTLLLTSPAPITNAKQQNPDLPYDPVKDLTPIIHVGDSPISLIGTAENNIKTFKELLEFAKANPGKVKIGNSGFGAIGHQAAALVAYKTGIQVTHVPYGGTGAIMTDLLGGRVDAAAGFPASFVATIKEGRLRGLVLLSDKRNEELPDMPSIAESGYPDAQLNAWYVMFAPAGTPADVTAKIRNAVGEFLKTDFAKERFKTLGYAVTNYDEKKSAEIIAKDTAAFTELLNAGAIQLK